MPLDTKEKDKDMTDIPDLEELHYYFFTSEFDNSSSTDAIRFIMQRNLMKKKPKQMKMIINSPGGCVASAFALIDMMKGSKVPVYTYGLGEILLVAY